VQAVKGGPVPIDFDVSTSGRKAVRQAQSVAPAVGGNR